MSNCIDCVHCCRSSQGYYCDLGTHASGFGYGLGYAIGSAIFNKKADFSRFHKSKIEEYWSEEEAENRSTCKSFSLPKRCIICGHCKIGKTLITRKEYYYCDDYLHMNGGSYKKLSEEEVNRRNSCPEFILK